MKKAVLVGPFIGEMFWEFFRFVPFIVWNRLVKYKKYPEIKFIILTRPENFDMYGLYADIFIPLRILGDGDEYFPDSYRLTNFPQEKYDLINTIFHQKYSREYEIIDHIKPNIEKGFFSQKNQFPKEKMIYDYKPRKENEKIVYNEIINDKPMVVLAPRYRSQMRRNWYHWDKLYDLIYNSEMMEKFNFIICGKSPDYFPDKKNRFKDINKISLNCYSSLIGLTIEILNKSILTVGSQSAIPNISLLMGTEALEWGHQKELHTQTYNIKNTKVEFLEDHKYKVDSNVVFEKLKNRLLKGEY